MGWPAAAMLLGNPPQSSIRNPVKDTGQREDHAADVSNG